MRDREPRKKSKRAAPKARRASQGKPKKKARTQAAASRAQRAAGERSSEKLRAQRAKGERSSEKLRAQRAAGERSSEKPRTQRAAGERSSANLGERALQTRQRLLEATEALLRVRGLRELSVVEIAREVGTSPATFYQYFEDVPDAVRRLAEQAADEMPALLARIDGPWRGRQGLETARSLVDAFVSHWDAHHAVLRIRNLAAEEGDRRFQRVRRAALAPLLERLAERIAAFQEEGRVAPQIHPHAAAAALASILERLAAYHKELEYYGVSRDDLVESCAWILVQTLTGRPPPSPG